MAARPPSYSPPSGSPPSGSKVGDAYSFDVFHRVLGGWSLVQNYRCGYPGLIADYPSGVPMTGQVFSQVDIPGSQAVNCSISQPDLRLTGQSDYVLTPGSDMPIEEPVGGLRPEHDTFGILYGSPIGAGWPGLSPRCETPPSSPEYSLIEPTI